MIEPRVLLSTRVKQRTRRWFQQIADGREMKLSAYIAQILDDLADREAKRQEATKEKH